MGTAIHMLFMCSSKLYLKKTKFFEFRIFLPENLEFYFLNWCFKRKKCVLLRGGKIVFIMIFEEGQFLNPKYVYFKEKIC